MAAALILIVCCQLSGLFTHFVYDSHWYASNLLRFLPVFALTGGQLALYSDTVAVERARVKHLSLLQGITHDIVASLDLPAVLQGVVRSTAEVVSYAQKGAPTRAILFRVDNGVVSVMAHHEFGISGQPEQVAFSLENAPLLKAVLESGEGQVAAVRQKRGQVTWPEDPLVAPDVASIAYAPVASREGVVGILGAANLGRRTMDAEVLSLIQGVADLAALAIRNAAAFQTISDVASIDALTGLRNRREFERVMDRMPVERFSILAMDVDALKTVNDEYGHQAGDLVLRTVARTLAASFRGDDVVARVGGDEFAALLPGADNATAGLVADRIRSAIRAVEVPYGAKRMSIGFAAGPAGGDPREVWGWADEALYRAKKQGRDRAESFDGQVPRDADPTAHWAELIPQLLSPSGIVSLYQPIVRLSDRSLIGYEALARPGGDLAMESVEGLFSTATKIGMGSELDWFGRRAAVVGASSISTDKELFINVSVPALLDPLHDVDQMELLLRWAGRSSDQIVFEISEREAVTDMARFEAVLARYRAAGFRFAIDDVGEGHSTLEVLAASSPEYIKIAARLARTSHLRGPRAAVAALVTFARSLDARVIAEGLETYDQVNEMCALGVEFGQGYYLGTPALVSPLSISTPSPASAPAPAWVPFVPAPVRAFSSAQGPLIGVPPELGLGQ
jgi:diguanylate cyclase (GGDEF)-like protein